MLDTLSNVKSRLGITGSTYDTFLTGQIQLISDVIEAYCRRKFLSAVYEQKFYREDNRANNMMTLFHFPVSEVASIIVDDVEWEDSFFRTNEQHGIVRSLVGPFFTASETVVTYTAGYATCPTPILGVLDALVEERYNKKTSGVGLNFGSDVQRISIPGTISIDFDYTLANNDRKSAYGTIIGNYANILDDWRSERAVLGNDKLIFITSGTPADELDQLGFWHTETFVLGAGDITNGYLDLARVALVSSAVISGNGALLVEGASYDYTVNLTGGVGSKTRITFLNNMVTGPSALAPTDIVQIRYQAEPE